MATSPIRVEDVPKEVVAEIRRQHLIDMLRETHGVFDMKKESRKDFRNVGNKRDVLFGIFISGFFLVVLYLAIKRFE